MSNVHFSQARELESESRYVQEIQLADLFQYAMSELTEEDILVVAFLIRHESSCAASRDHSRSGKRLNFKSTFKTISHPVHTTLDTRCGNTQILYKPSHVPKRVAYENNVFCSLLLRAKMPTVLPNADLKSF